jgi:hypothetical protein
VPIVDHDNDIGEEVISYYVECSQKRNFDDSIKYCESNGDFIASVHNQKDYDKILVQIKRQCGKDFVGAYIGAKSDGNGNWSWKDGSK